MAKFNMDSLTSILVNLLTENNTNTSSLDISSGLDTRVRTIVRGKYEKKVVQSNAYPAIFVRILDKEKEWSEIGNTARRNHFVTAEIIGTVMHGGVGGAQISDKNNLILSSNIENLIDNKIKLSNTVDECIVEGIEYNTELDEEENFNVQSRHVLKIRKLA